MADYPDYQVSLSYASEQRPLVEQVAAKLAAALGRERVFFDQYHQADFARFDLDLHLQRIYRERSRLVVVFFGGSYERKGWPGVVEWRAIRDLMLAGESERIMPLRAEEGEVSGLFGIDHLVDVRHLDPAAIADLILDRLRRLDAPSRALPVEPRVTRPGLIRYLMDRLCPRLHARLTDLGALREPPERAELTAYLRELGAHIETEIREKTYLPLSARSVPAPGSERARDPFERPVQRLIRHVLGHSEGGDSVNVQTAAVHRRSRIVRNIVRTLLRSPTPLVLLGEPGSGKSMTLQQIALDLAASESRRVFPVVALYVRLGEFHLDGRIGPREVLRYVISSSPARIRSWIEDLDRNGRLVVLFDGMDEMSRDRYNEHTAALSDFAGSRPPGTRTLFSCRITDFSPTFVHSRLVLLPFERAQITRFLRQHVLAPSLVIDGRPWSLPRLARRLAAGDLPVEASNPFVLWLLCLYLQEEQTWPESRVSLLDFFLAENYERKRREAEEEGVTLPPAAEAFRAWAGFAFAITERNRGSAIPVAALLADAEDASDADEAERLRSLVRLGKRCGILAESIQEAEHLVRFEHHRFQEHFTALWIREQSPSIAWLDKLDAPRWQETMINLVLMGGAEDGVAVLSQSIASEIAARRPGLPKDDPAVAYSHELLLADRVELGARLVHHGAHTSAAVRERLQPVLRTAVATLVDSGRPITQVKMMRACQHLKDVDLLRELDKPLRSPVHWVRDQALLLVAAPGLPGTSDLPSEMGVDLAAGTFLRRWAVYLKAVVSAGQRRSRAAFAVASLCGAAELALSLAAAGGLFLLSMWIAQTFHFPKAPNHFKILTGPQLYGLQALLTGIALAAALVSRPSRLWSWVIGSGPVGFLLIETGCCIWVGDGDFFFPFVFVCLFGGGLIVLPVVLLGLAVDQGVLAVYAVVTRPWRKAGLTTRSILSLSWKERGFGPPLLINSSWAGFVALGLFLIVGIPRLLDDLLVPWLARLLSIPRQSANNYVWEVVAGIGALFVLVRLLIRQAVHWRERPLKLRLLAMQARLAERVAKAGRSITTREGLRDMLGAWARTARGCLGAFAGLVLLAIVMFFSRTVLVLVLGLIAVLLARMAAAWTWGRLAVRREFPSASWAPEDWRAALRSTSSKPREQSILLARTSSRSLGLRPEEYLRLLVDVEPLIQKEPALSTYWGRRDQLEQALRQEKQG